MIINYIKNISCRINIISFIYINELFIKINNHKNIEFLINVLFLYLSKLFDIIKMHTISFIAKNKYIFYDKRFLTCVFHDFLLSNKLSCNLNR